MLQPSSLWAQFVRAKYNFTASWYDYKCKRRMFTIWQQILKVGTYISFQFQWLVGSGDLINVYNDLWISPISIMFWPTNINMINFDINLHVHHFINIDSCWDVRSLSQHFPMNLWILFVESLCLKVCGQINLFGLLWSNCRYPYKTWGCYPRLIG